MAELDKSIVLVGLMGSGKSSVGRRLADKLNVDFIDVDEEIVNVSEMTIAEIFEQYGEDEFRALETRVLARLMNEPTSVIATGGGAFVSAKNRALIAKNGISVWLDADLDTLWERVKGKTHRPLLLQNNPKDVLAELLEKRNPDYQLADHRVPSYLEQSHDDMVERICEAIGISS